MTSAADAFLVWNGIVAEPPGPARAGDLPEVRSTAIETADGCDDVEAQPVWARPPTSSAAAAPSPQPAP